MARSALRIGLWLLAGLTVIAPYIPAAAHHRSAPRDGTVLGVAVPAITHGQMLVLAKYRATILDLAARQPVTDPTLRRLEGFISLQYFACFRGLVPGSLSDELSPFNECAHAYLAGTRALLAHMAHMPGDQSAAKALQERINAEIASDPIYGSFCSNSEQVFDSAIIVPPDWTMFTSHPPTVLTFAAFTLLVSAGAGAVFYRLWRFKA